jgi:chemotaxis methyl-accepting protein methylase
MRRAPMPEGVFDLIFCRNLVLTYFEPALRREVFGRILERLRAGGAVVIGIHRSCPKATFA